MVGIERGRGLTVDECVALCNAPRKLTVKHIETVSQERNVYFDDFTRDLLIRYLEGRKKGPLVVSSRVKRLSSREAERVVDYYARSVDIQKVMGHTMNGREIRLVTC